MELSDSIDIIVGEGGVQTFKCRLCKRPVELFYTNPDSILPQESTYVIAYMDAEVLLTSGNDVSQETPQH